MFLDSELAARAEDLCRTPVDESLQPCTVDVTLTGPDTVTRFAAPSRLGGRVAISRGFTTWQLTDYEVEIAEAAAVANPYPSIAFDGLLFDLRIAEPLTDSEVDGPPIRAWLHTERHRLGPLRTVDLEGEHLGKLFLHDQWVQRFDHQGPIDSGLLTIRSTADSPERSTALRLQVR